MSISIQNVNKDLNKVSQDYQRSDQSQQKEINQLIQGDKNIEVKISNLRADEER